MAQDEMRRAFDASGSPSADACAACAWGLWATFGWFLAAIFIELAVIAAAGFLYRFWSTSGAGQPLGLSLPAALLPAASIVAGCCVTAIIFLAARSSGRPVAEYLGLCRPSGRYVLFGLLVLVLSLGMTLVAAYGLDLKLGGAAQSPAAVAAFGVTAVVLRWISSIVVAPLWEELLFRGFLYRGISESRLGVKGAVAVTAVLWALVHANRTWFGLVEMVLCGLLYGWLRWRTGSTLTTIVVHALNNAALLMIAALV